MVSKTIVFLCLSIAIVLLVSSEVAAAGEPVETTTSKTTSGTSYGLDQRGGCRFGCCRFFNGFCRRCCRNAEEAANVEVKAKPHN